MDGLVGKTIAAVTGDEFGDRVLVFTDGTRALLEGTGYEVDGVRITPLSAAEWLEAVHEHALQENRRREAAAHARARREVEDHMRELLDDDTFAEWMDEHRPGWRWVEAMQQEIEASWADLFRGVQRQVYGDTNKENV